MRSSLVSKSVWATLLVLALALFNSGCVGSSSTNGIPANLKVGDSFHFGDYGGYDTTWQVLDIEGGRALVVTKYVIDLRDYHDQLSDTTWAKSSVRKWLNDDFYSTAFSESERAAITKTKVVNASNSEHNTPGGENTEDYVFLLSLDEVKRYLPTPESRLADLNLTSEVEKAAAKRIASKKYLGSYDTYDKILKWIQDMDRSDVTPAFWWLRSPGSDARSAATVNQHGEILGFGTPVSGFAPYFGVRPAMWIDTDPTARKASTAEPVTEPARPAPAAPIASTGQPANSESADADPRWPTTNPHLLAVPEADRWYNSKKRIGKRGTIAGRVASVAYLKNRIMVNIGNDYKKGDHNRAQIVIWPERWEDFRDILDRIDVGDSNWVAVSGKISKRDGVAEIDVNDSDTRWRVLQDVTDAER